MEAARREVGIGDEDDGIQNSEFKLRSEATSLFDVQRSMFGVHLFDDKKL
jgi:hypothetical protein